MKPKFILLSILIPILCQPLFGEEKTESRVPDRPYRYVLDQPKILTPTALLALQSILIEHDRLTGQQFMIGIFEDASKEPGYLKEVFQKWKIGSGISNNGILLAVFYNQKKAQFQIGDTLDLSEAKLKETISESIQPYLDQGDVNKALILGTFTILEELESPLIQSGKMDEILEKAGLTDSLDPPPPAPSNWTLILFLLFGLVTASIVSIEITAQEAHYTRTGWFRHRFIFSYLLSRFKSRSDQNLGLGGTYGSW